MYQFILPDIGEGVVEAEVLNWLVKEGDPVNENQVIVELMTDKATVEIPCPKAGRIHKLCFAVGEIAPVGEVLLEIDTEATNAQANSPTSEVQDQTINNESPPPEVEEQSKPEESQTPPPPPPAESSERKASTSNKPPSMPPRPHREVPLPDQFSNQKAHAVPAVREYAKQQGVDINKVEGSGPQGRIMKRDIEFYLNHHGETKSTNNNPTGIPATNDPEDWVRKPVRGLRKAIAHRMSHSSKTAAHYTYVEEVDLTDLMQLRKKFASEGIQLSPLAFITKACIESLADFPILNACMDDERNEIIFKKSIHIGIATATQDGLTVPVIHDATSCDLTELSDKIKDLAERARNRKLKPEELKNGTFTISSLGKIGGLFATPIINYPQSAIVGIHNIQKLPRYIDNELLPRDIMNLSISLDHRIVDGQEAAEFIQAVKIRLEKADFNSRES